MYPSCGTLGDEGYVVVWASSHESSYYYGIFGQRYKADGTKVWIEFKISND